MTYRHRFGSTADLMMQSPSNGHPHERQQEQADRTMQRFRSQASAGGLLSTVPLDQKFTRRTSARN